jgi:phasin
MAGSQKKVGVTPAPEPMAPPMKAILAREEAAAAEVGSAVESALSAPAMAASRADASKAFEAPAALVADAQENVRATLEKRLTETRATYSRAKSAADEASSAFETSFTNAKSGIVEMNVKALEALRASAYANFDFLKSIVNVKSAADFVTLQTEFTRKQVEILTGQTKEFGALAQKVANDTVEPLKAQAAKTFKTAV